MMAMHFADEALIVTNPEVSSVRDSDRILGMLGSKTKRAKEGGDPIKEHLLITRYNPNRVAGGQMLSLEDIQDILRIKLIGVIPESESVLQASNQGMPGDPRQGDRRGAGLQRRGGALPRRRQADALRRRREARLLQALLRREVRSHVLSLFPAGRKEEDRQRRQGAAADHPRARALAAWAPSGPTTCRTCSAS